MLLLQQWLQGLLYNLPCAASEMVALLYIRWRCMQSPELDAKCLVLEAVGTPALGTLVLLDLCPPLPLDAVS